MYRARELSLDVHVDEVDSILASVSIFSVFVFPIQCAGIVFLEKYEETCVEI